MSLFKKSNNPLQDAIRELANEQSREYIIAFAKKFKALYSQETWVLIPGRQTEKGFELCLFEERGKTYAAFFSDGREAKKHNGDILSTDIENVIKSVFENEEIAGIVIDPYSIQFYMEKHFIAQCLLHDED